MSARPLACALAFAFAGLIPGCGGSEAERPASAPEQRPADFVGLVSEDVFGGDAAYRRRNLALQRDAGVRLLRQTFSWKQIERTPGRFELAKHDRYVAEAARKQMRLLPVLFDPPTFRSSAPARGARRGTYPPRRNEDFARYARALALRYGPAGSFWRERPDVPRLPVRSWQVWNEPSIPVYWPTGPDPAAYTRLLRTSARALKQVDPRAEIVSAGLAESRLGVPFDRFVRGMYAAGAADAFDTLAVHAYARDVDGVMEAVRSGRRVIDDSADDARLWVTEAGWATGGPRGPFTVSERRQAELVGELVRRLSAEAPALGVRGIVYFNWKDSTPFAGGSEFFGLHTGLLRIGGRPKPALNAFRRAASQAR